MKRISLAIMITAFVLVGCSDTRILPSDTIGVVFYFQPVGEVNLFSIEFDSDNSGFLREWSPGFDPLAPGFDPDAPGFDENDPSDDVEEATDPFTVSGLDGTRHLTGATFSSDAGILIARVSLYTFRSYGFSEFNASPYRYNLP